MPDGCRLAARLWLPEDAETSPVPAVVEYIPYRKRDFTRVRDEPMHHYFAGHGHAAVRVDVRGSGDSEGVLTDEYAEQELADGEAIIAWIAAQPWCTGAVGMIGKSWGGFNALQIAARQPPALKAIITVCASDDRFADDAHYMGGCLLNENLTWGAVLMAFAALPPDPQVVGERWRDMWLARLDQAVCFPEIWLRHQRRDAYWRRGSVCEEPGRITCPVYAVGGWADAYTNAIPRLMAGLAVPRKALIGPWGHVYPHRGVPGPAIGFLQEALRWWDRWLAGVETGVTDDPRYRVWLADRWIAQDEWSSSSRRWFLNPNALDETPGAESAVECRSPQSVGLASGEWCRFEDVGDAPADQGSDDAGSLTFDSAPLAERLEIVGAPVVSLELTVDRPQALLAMRLNEVFPDGRSERVTYGVLNPGVLLPGRRSRARVALNQVAHAFAAGSRVRLAISTAYWPLVWPSPSAVGLVLFTGASCVDLPVRPVGDDQPWAAPEPEGAPLPVYRELRPSRVERTVERNGREVVLTITQEGGAFRAGGPGRIEAIDLEVEESTLRRYRIRDDDPLAARAEITQRMGVRRDGWSVRVESQAELSATAGSFELHARLCAFEADRLVRSRSWRQSIPRDGV